jgi:hypothetical protein
LSRGFGGGGVMRVGATAGGAAVRLTPGRFSLKPGSSHAWQNPAPGSSTGLSNLADGAAAGGGGGGGGNATV